MNTFEIPVSQKAYDQALAMAWVDAMMTLDEYRSRQIPIPMSYMRYTIHISLDFIEALRSHSGDSPQLSEAAERFNAILARMPAAAWAESVGAT